MKRVSRSSLEITRRGAAAVECALLLPLLCFLFVGTVDFSRIYYFSVTIDNCARNGALYGCADSTQAQNASGIRAAAQKDASNLDLQSLGIRSTTDGTSYVSVTVTYPFSTIVNYPGVPHQINLSRTVRMNILPNTPTF